MTFEGIPLRALPMTLYTELFVVRGILQTRQHRLTDILNTAEEPFLVLEDVSLEEFGSRHQPATSEFAQVNLSSILFAVTLQTVQPVSELHLRKVAERAFLSIPPFRVMGNIHLLPDRTFRESLAGLHSKFVPVTDAVFWSDRERQAPQTAAMVAVNRSRAQIFAPFHETAGWAAIGPDPGGAPETVEGPDPA
jgi:hypothetical protein